MLSLKKEDLLNISHNLTNENIHNRISLENEGVRKEISYQLLFVTEVLNFYHVYKSNRSLENFAIFASGCSAIGFFSSSSIILGAMNSGISLRQLISMGSGTISWYGIGFIFHFAMLMTSFYIQDEVKIDQQWLAQLLLCYRSSVLRMALILNNYIENNKLINQDENDLNSNVNIEEIKQLLENSENLIKRFDQELDPEQIKKWLEYAIDDNVNITLQKQAFVGYIAIPISMAISSKCLWSKWSQNYSNNKLNIHKFTSKSHFDTKWQKIVCSLVDGVKRFK